MYVVYITSMKINHLYTKCQRFLFLKINYYMSPKINTIRKNILFHHALFLLKFLKSMALENIKCMAMLLMSP